MNQRRFAVPAVLALLLTLAVAMPTAAAEVQQRERIVVGFHDTVQDPHVAARDFERRHGGRVTFVYEHALKGFAGEFPRSSLAGIERDRRVRFVELDLLAHTYSQETPTGVQRVFADDNAEIDIDGSDDFRVDVDVAVIDTGIDLDHADLHVVASTDCSGGSPLTASCGTGGDDDNGHGTHVAGSVAALDDGSGVVGVAPGARLHAVRVLRADGSGYISWIVAGIDYVTERAATIEVANMSLGCECTSQAMDEAIAASVDAGVAYAVAAGNSDADAETFSPANHPDVITVSALADFDGEPGGVGAPTCRADEDDTLAGFSNFGALVEAAAPGVCIRSTWNDGGYHTISGTSMASPHVAGAAALLASGDNDPQDDTDVAAIRQTIVDSGNFDWSDDSGDGMKEPLLGVGDSNVYNPALVSGGDGDGGGDPAALALDAAGYKVKGVQHADLTWQGATSTNVDVYRDGAVIATTANDGAYTDDIGAKGAGSYTYKVCEAGTTICSNEATVAF
ncbi:MAG TPA: S8 family serine peptidase [Egibacteraceae bacterium]|nr:S8 family serine peptidase [Actinomycetota bacterium]HWB73287.1 S8 family serine peptidase [Egibacteraceae bacterium]